MRANNSNKKVVLTNGLSSGTAGKITEGVAERVRTSDRDGEGSVREGVE